MTKIEFLKILDVDRDALFRVIVKYDDYPQFVHGVKSVKVVRTSRGHSVVTYRLSLLKDIGYTLRLVEREDLCSVTWSLLESEFFKTNNGSWEVKSLGPGRCEVKCSLELEFRVSVPTFILKRLVKKRLSSLVRSFEKRAREK